jgi:type II secretory pathway component PulK
MTNRRGFALLAVLWLVAALGMMAAVGLAAGRTGAAVTRNRILLTRAGWAREACIAILMARVAEDSAAALAGARIRSLPSVDLGRGTWCAAQVEDPAARINLNRADSATLNRLFRSGELVHALLDWRKQHGPLDDATELRFVSGFDSSTAARFADLTTTRGSGGVNVNEASPEVLGAIAGLPGEAIELVLSRRRVGRPIASLEELLALVSRPSAQILLQDYTGWLTRVRFTPAQLTARVTGGVAGTPIVIVTTLMLAPAPGRLAMVRRESE